MAASTFGSKNQPIFGALDAPDVAINPTQAAEYAAKVGNRRTGTAAERLAATGADVWEQLHWGDTTDGLEYVRVGSSWLVVRGGMIGVAAASVSQTLTTSAVALSGLSLTVSTPAVPVRIRATVQLNNAGSGADRTASLQLFEDTTALGLARTFTVPLVGSGGMVAAVLTLNRTPSAGSHTYTVKASASIATAITLGDCDIDVTVIS